MQSSSNAQDKIKVAYKVVSRNHMIFMTNSFPRLISLPTSTNFILGTSGITAILKVYECKSDQIITIETIIITKIKLTKLTKINKFKYK